MKATLGIVHAAYTHDGAHGGGGCNAKRRTLRRDAQQWRREEVRLKTSTVAVRATLIRMATVFRRWPGWTRRRSAMGSSGGGQDGATQQKRMRCCCCQ
jgi:hypothetical protein